MIFSYNADIKKTAYMNWRTDKHNTDVNFAVIADGYFIAAQTLTEKYIENNIGKDADSVIYPILFNTIHGTELYLKAMYIRLAYLLKKDQKFAGGHNIKSLFGMVYSLVEEIKNDNNKFYEYKRIMNPLEDFIDEVYSKTEHMDFSRYSVDNRNKENYFYIDTIENEVVNLPKLLEAIKKISSSLQQVFHHFLYDYEQEYNY